MDLLATILLTILLVVAVVLLHYEALLNSSRLAERLTIPPRTRILVVIAAAFVAHIAEIGLFAAGYFAMERLLGIGALAGHLAGTSIDFFYFSTTMYTTLGIGDIWATGPIRIVAGIESLTGLVLITWTASFSYLAMERFWGGK
jgi:hypothetical protein